MIPFWLWSYLLMAVGVTGLYLSGSKKAYGWLIGLGAQVLWLAYGLSTHQYGFIISCAFYGSVYARNYLRWRRESGQGIPASKRAPRAARRRAWRSGWDSVSSREGK